MANTNPTRFDFIETDKRIIEQKRLRHQMSQTEYQKLLKPLADDAENADELLVYQEGDDLTTDGE